MGEKSKPKKEYKSSVYVSEEELDNTTNMVRKRRVVELKGQESTEDLIKLAKEKLGVQ